MNIPAKLCPEGVKAARIPAAKKNSAKLPIFKLQSFTLI